MSRRVHFFSWRTSHTYSLQCVEWIVYMVATNKMAAVGGAEKRGEGQKGLYWVQLKHLASAPKVLYKRGCWTIHTLALPILLFLFTLFGYADARNTPRTH